MTVNSKIHRFACCLAILLGPSLASAANYRVVYSFQGAGDGSGPQASLTNVGGALYGATTGGGGSGCASFDYGCGTIFKIAKNSDEKVLHVFGKGTDGIQPQSALVDVGGLLYGDTAFGAGTGCGGFGCGAIYEFNPKTGAESVVHAFTGGSDGEMPESDLIAVNGLLYGTTVFGGDGGNCAGAGSGCGTVFHVDAKGAENVLYAFKGAAGDDGGEPVAGLLQVGKDLYGTTLYDFPILFDVSETGVETVRHFFSGGVLDGSGPSGAVVELGGVLYGTTAQGGGKGCPIESFDKGCGTVFSFTAKAGETILYSFQGGSDGSSPTGKLVALNGVLYGVTPGGGGASGCNYIYSSGCGTIYSVTTSGKEKVLHVFGAAAGDGKQPMAGLTNVDGVLYGTTSQGGRYGFGTVFEITP